ncbi:FecR family protein [Butyricimonas faecihominis]|jgi:hypothetical protein|nr:FecR family protein [Butyricimonas faecihominis]WOF07534.1 FecR family protein [Butyricimonas faecihominis]
MKIIMSEKIRYLVRRAFNSMKEEPYDVDMAWKRVKRQHVRNKEKKLFYSFFKYVACFVFIIGSIYMTWKYIPFRNTSSHLQVQCLDSTRKIKLLLANGEQLLFESNQKISTEELNRRISPDSTIKQLGKQFEGKEQDSLQYNKLYVPKGADFYLKLSDGSVVNINSESTLHFPVEFSSENREVYLEGEAFFDVVREDKFPFKVHTGDKTITVLGTKFNVSAYRDDQEWMATLVQGKISVTARDFQQVLLPSQQLCINKETGETTVKEVETELYTSWVDGKFYFKGYRFEDIAKKMERWYDVVVVYQNEEIKDMKFRGVIDKHVPLKQTLMYLEKTTDIKFEINDKVIIVSKIN